MTASPQVAPKAGRRHPRTVSPSPEGETRGAGVVAYLRASSLTQLDGYGLDVQRAAVDAWARLHGRNVVARYVDEGVAGTTDAMDRDGLSAAMLHLRDDRSVDTLLVPRLDRLARALTVQEAALSVVWGYGCQVVDVDTGTVPQDDPDDPMRTAIRQIMGAIAQLERALIVKRLRDGRRAKAAQGRHAVSAYPYGYRGEGHGRERDAAPDPSEQETVRRIIELRAQGVPYRAICDALDAEERRPRRSERWSPGSVWRVASREARR